MSAKDRVLVTLAPHLVLDGAAAAADAVGARSIVVAIAQDAGDARSSVRHALGERRDRRRFTIAHAPDAHLAGEETALINHLNGGPLKPTTVPPHPSQRGVRRRPTLVQNPETLAHMALIGRHGAPWFRELGTAAHPGSALVTVSGAVTAPGVREIPAGIRLATVLDAAGRSEPLQAVLVGGYHGIFVPAHALETVTLDDAGLSELGGGLGAGVIVALGESACGVAELDRALGWLADQSAGQCGPCVHGLSAVAELLSAMVAGRAPAGAQQRLARWSGQLAGRGACKLPDGAVRLLHSGLRAFGEDLADHAAHGACEACRRMPTLTFARPPGRQREAA